MQLGESGRRLYSFHVIGANMRFPKLGDVWRHRFFARPIGGKWFVIDLDCPDQRWGKADWREASAEAFARNLALANSRMKELLVEKGLYDPNDNPPTPAVSPRLQEFYAAHRMVERPPRDWPAILTCKCGRKFLAGDARELHDALERHDKAEAEKEDADLPKMYMQHLEELKIWEQQRNSRLNKRH